MKYKLPKKKTSKIMKIISWRRQQHDHKYSSTDAMRSTGSDDIIDQIFGHQGILEDSVFYSMCDLCHDYDDDNDDDDAIINVRPRGRTFTTSRHSSSTTDSFRKPSNESSSSSSNKSAESSRIPSNDSYRDGEYHLHPRGDQIISAEDSTIEDIRYNYLHINAEKVLHIGQSLAQSQSSLQSPHLRRRLISSPSILRDPCNDTATCDVIRTNNSCTSKSRVSLRRSRSVDELLVTHGRQSSSYRKFSNPSTSSSSPPPVVGKFARYIEINGVEYKVPSNVPKHDPPDLMPPPPLPRKMKHTHRTFLDKQEQVDGLGQEEENGPKGGFFEYMDSSIEQARNSHCEVYSSVFPKTSSQDEMNDFDFNCEYQNSCAILGLKGVIDKEGNSMESLLSEEQEENHLYENTLDFLHCIDQRKSCIYSNEPMIAMKRYSHSYENVCEITSNDERFHQNFHTPNNYSDISYNSNQTTNALITYANPTTTKATESGRRDENLPNQDPDLTHVEKMLTFPRLKDQRERTKYVTLFTLREDIQKECENEISAVPKPSVCGNVGVPKHSVCGIMGVPKPSVCENVGLLKPSFCGNLGLSKPSVSYEKIWRYSQYRKVFHGSANARHKLGEEETA